MTLGSCSMYYFQTCFFHLTMYCGPLSKNAQAVLHSCVHTQHRDHRKQKEFLPPKRPTDVKKLGVMGEHN